MPCSASAFEPIYHSNACSIALISIIRVDLFQQLRTLEYVKQKGASGHKEFAAMAQKMSLQTRT